MLTNPVMGLGAIFLRGLGRQQHLKAALLSAWFFVTIATLWILKPVRVASLLAHLGAAETPYVRLASVATMAVVVMLYSRVVNRLSRVAVVRWSNLLFAALLGLFWIAIQVGGPALGAQRPFVWAVYILVEIYSVVMIGIFWTYTNDVVTEDEAAKLYGVIGLGGILGGVAGGAFVDAFARTIGPIHLLLVSGGLVLISAVLGSVIEAVLRPAPRRSAEPEEGGLDAALGGAREVKNSKYLLLIVGIVVAYEFTATLTDFGVNVIFERSFTDEGELTKMYGRLGWIVSATAVVSQLVLVPLLLPSKRIALLLPPLVMLVGAVGVVLLPVVAMALVLSAADRGLNYSLQQVTKESLYVSLTDAQKYKAKAFIDMFVDRAAKAMAAFALIGVIHYWGASVRVSVGVSIVSIAAWLAAALRLGAHFRPGNAPNARPNADTTEPAAPPEGVGAPPATPAPPRAA